MNCTPDSLPRPIVLNASLLGLRSASAAHFRNYGASSRRSSRTRSAMETIDLALQISREHNCLLRYCTPIPT
jgi:hypothetical protein